MSLLGTSIATRLFRINLILSGAVLALACLGLFVYDQITVRAALVRNLSAQARLIGFNSVSALTFNDPESAKRTLSAFEESTLIEGASIVRPDGVPFAQYSRKPTQPLVSLPPLPVGKNEEHWFNDDGLLLAQRIRFHSDDLGTVYLRSNLGILEKRRLEYPAIAGAALLLSLLAVVPFSIRFRRSISQPVGELAAAAQQVTRDKDYGLRVTTQTDTTELAILIQSFNQMLAEVDQRDQRLLQAAAELEQRVQERTQQLAATNRELEAFSYSVSHDLRGPLETMNGFSYMLSEKYGDRLDEQGRAYLEQVRSASSRMSHLIDDLLKLSQVGGGALHRESVDISALSRQVAAELQQREPRRKVRFVIQDCAPAEGDSRLLLIVVENLIRNSWKYTSNLPEAVIEVGCKPLGNGHLYFVRDNGAGFEPGLSDRLFKPFQRLHSTAEFPGTGIGLATVQRIINRHGGRVWAEGAVGNGATFYFTLRAAAPESLSKTV